MLLLHQAQDVKHGHDHRLMGDVDQQRMASSGVDERLRQAPRQEAPPGGIDQPAQRGSNQKNAEPGDQGEIVERGITRAVDPERQQPIETDRHALFKKVKRRAEPENENTPSRAGDRPGFLERRSVDQDRDGKQLEDAEPDGRGWVEDVGDRSDSDRHGQEPQAPADIAPGQRAARPRQDDEEPGEEVLGHCPGNRC